VEPYWNVVVVRHPPPPPGSRAPPSRSMVAYAGADRACAERTAAGLRGIGADVALVEGDPGSLCGRHPTQLAGESCTACAAHICAACRADAAGRSVCAGCAARARHRVRNTRLRKLLAFFVLAVFFQQAWGWNRRENALVDATGPVRVAFIQFVRPEAVGADIVDEMTRIGLPAVAPWYQAERARYTGSGGGDLHADILGPFVADVRPPAVPRDPDFFDLLRVSLAFPSYFHDLARAHGVDPEAYGARVYIVYGKESDDLAADSRGSRKGRIAVSFVPVGSSLAYAQLTVTHELGHIFGAPDQYDPDSFLAEFPAGYVQPWADPPYPQRWAEVMAVDIPISPNDEREVRGLDDVRVGYRTAAHFGWIAEQQAEVYYSPSIRGPELALIATEADTDIGTR
jgi:hypothetical protein